MTQPDAEEMREGALAALAYVEASLHSDAEHGAAEHEVILKAFKRAEIEAGALVLVHMLLDLEAKALGMPATERIAQVRNIVRGGRAEF